MARVAFQRVVLCLAVTGWLSGCVEGTAPAGSAGTAAPAPGQVRSGSGREVEAPEVFQSTDSALWDGRPSLGGIWVASPEAVDPERVVMVNVATGKSVAGALFRRERDNPGPTLQVSSDAADALGMLAGQPAELRVTALRKVDKPTATVPDAAADATGGDGSAEETAALAAAALAATGADAKPEAAADATAGADTGVDAGAAAEGAAVAAEAGAVVAGAVAVDAATGAEPAKRKTWKERRAEAKAKREADKAAAAAAAAGGDAAGAAAEAAAPTAESAGVAAVETAPLDARSPEVAAAAEAATDAPPPEPVKKTRKEIRAEEKAAKQAAAAEAAAAETAAAEAVGVEPAAGAPVPQAEAQAAAGASSGRPIQVASFSKEENANRAVEALAKIGVTATSQKSDKAGKIVWGVVAVGDDALLKSIKGAGFADAYFLK